MKAPIAGNISDGQSDGQRSPRNAIHLRSNRDGRVSGKAFPRTIATIGPFLTVIEAANGLRQYLARWPGSWYQGKLFRLVRADAASISSPSPSFVMAPAAGSKLGPSVQPMTRL
jgi:hypothetical protein